MLLVETSVKCFIYAPNHWDCATFRWWYESICRDGTQWQYYSVKLAYFLSNSFDIYPGMAQKIMAADFHSAERTQPHAEP